MHAGFAPLRTLWPINIRLRRRKEPTRGGERDVARFVTFQVKVDGAASA